MRAVLRAAGALGWLAVGNLALAQQAPLVTAGPGMTPPVTGNTMIAIPTPPLRAAMSRDQTVDSSRTAIINRANVQCTTGTDTEALNTPEKQVTCRLRAVMPMAIGVGFTLAANQVADNEWRANMTDDQVKAAMAREQMALPSDYIGRMVDTLWMQHAEDCGGLPVGEESFSCEQRAQFNAGLTLGVSMYINGESVHLFDDLKGPRLQRKPRPSPTAKPVAPVHASGTLSTRR